MTKPTNPNLAIPEGFALNGQKTDFSDDKIQSGFDPVDPDVLAGDNLNKFIDDAYKGLNYSIDGVSDLYKSNIVYDENETYNQSSIVFGTDENNKIALYKSLADNNTSNPLTDTTKWQKVDLGADLDKINQSKALTTGAVSTDADVFADIQIYAHSTFDKSKFEVVGSPSITDDGIASGFTGTDYLTVNTSGMFNNNYNFEIATKVKYSSDTTLEQEIWDFSWIFRCRIQYLNNKHRLDFMMPQGSNYVATYANLEDYGFVDGDDLYVRCVSENASSRKLMFSKDGKTWHTITNTLTTDKDLTIYDLLKIGQYSSTVIWLTSNDLKQFSITVNGIPAFSGNQTGLDIIKPDDYTVVGTPTITADGVASGFSDGNYLKADNITLGDDFEIDYVINIPTLRNNNFILSGENNNYIQLSVTSTGSLQIDLGNGTSWITNANHNTQIEANTDTALKIKYTNNTLNVYKNGNLIDSTEVSGLNIPACNLLIGTNRAKATFTNGSIFLNSFKVYVDGSLVYQPCLKIPYTLSKTGSKIVDAAYRDRVKDVYEQYGTAMYYTIDEENQNFTLPMGEIYGMINQGGSGGGLEVGDIGIAAFGIDESKGLRRYLNGSILTLNANSQKFANKLKAAAASYPSLVCSEDEWQSISASSVGGQCGKFVIDETAGTIRLPKIIMPIQGLSDLTNLAEIVEAGLPNITGTFMNNGRAYDSADTAKYTGAFSRNNTTQNTSNAGASEDGRIINFNASNSNPIYGNSTTVQQEQIQYPYFIQIATGVEYEVNISNDIELNNPFTLFDSKYSDTPLYNASWLVSNGTYYPKSTYVSAYEALVVENNSEIDTGNSVTLSSGGSYVKRGLTVKLSTADDITDFDFVINTTDETFRLPLKTKLASGNAVVGNELSLGLTDGTSYAGTGTYTFTDMPGLISNRIAYYGVDVGSNIENTSHFGTAKTIGVTTDPQKSGLELSDSGLNLYYYIGETVQNANLINAGVLAEVKADRTDVDGQWVFNSKTLSTNGNAGTINLDLSNILPNDNYCYELLIFHSMHSSNSTLSNLYYQTDIYPRTQIGTTGVNGWYSTGTDLVITGSSHSLSRYIDVTTSNNVVAITLIGYRRLGKNN